MLSETTLEMRSITAWQFLAGADQGMGDAEETLGHDLQIGCQRYRRPIDVDVDHHSSPSVFLTA
jgi:hypothetical protein